jgi:hypothetical protein
MMVFKSSYYNSECIQCWFLSLHIITMNAFNAGSQAFGVSLHGKCSSHHAYMYTHAREPSPTHTNTHAREPSPTHTNTHARALSRTRTILVQIAISVHESGQGLSTERIDRI